jgi:hypothetical protein
LISIIEPSPHDAATAYVAATRYKLDDTKPYLYKTNDYGATWTTITHGIPETEFTRVIREDPECRGLLYAGTETGLYLSFDDGSSWERFQSNLPVCPIYDLIIKNGDLVVATHGRSFWILDDVTPLHGLAVDRGAKNRLFKPRDTARFKVYEGFGGGEGAGVLYRMAGPLTYAFRMQEGENGAKEITLLNAGKNPPNGVIITYFLSEKPSDQITLAVLDTDGTEIRTFSSKRVDEPEAEAAETKSTDADTGETPQASAEDSPVLADPEADAEEQEPFLPTKEGINRFVWNFRAANATRIPGDKFSEFATAGPPVPPGRYELRLTVGGEQFTESVEIQKDPRIETPLEDLEAQYQLGLNVRSLMSRLNEAVIQIRDLRGQLEGWKDRLQRLPEADEARAMQTRLVERLTGVEEEFMNTKATGRMMYPPPNVPTRLNQKLASLAADIASADALPTRQEYEVHDELRQRVEAQLKALEELVNSEIPAFNEALRNLEAPAIVVKPAGPGAE